MTSPVIRSSEAISRAIDCTHLQANSCSGCGEICVDVKRSFPKISADLDLFDQLSRDPGSFGGNHNIAKPSPGWDLNESIFTFIWSDLCQNCLSLSDELFPAFLPNSTQLREFVYFWTELPIPKWDIHLNPWEKTAHQVSLGSVKNLLRYLYLSCVFQRILADFGLSKHLCRALSVRT